MVTSVGKQAVACLITLVVWAGGAHAGGVGNGDGGEDGSGGANVTASVWDAVNGGVKPPPGKKNCGPWQLITSDPDAQELIVVLVNDEWGKIYVRWCEGTPQFTYLTPTDPRDIALDLRDDMRRDLPRPDPQFSINPRRLIVNMNTSFATTPHDPVTAIASIPGTTVTVTATPTKLTLTTGSWIPTETNTITCPPWGSLTQTTSCNWTPTYPSVQQVTGNTDGVHHARLAITWTVAWRSGTRTGTLNNLTTYTDIDLEIWEIQTLGTG
jgi:hypothetical protein